VSGVVGRWSITGRPRRPHEQVTARRAVAGSPLESRTTTPMTGDPRRGRRPARYRDDGPLPCHCLDLATGEWIAAIIDWAPEGEMIRTVGALFRDYREAWEASRGMARARRESEREEGREIP
jgi:hypothetical protein